jgi:putative sterol carrier protein
MAAKAGARAHGPTFARLRRLADASRGDMNSVLKSVADGLHEAGVKGKIQVSLLTGKDSWATSHMVLTATSAKTAKGAHKTPDFEILTDADTWGAVVEGKLAPLEAMARQRMRIRGDTRLASAILKRVAGTEGRTDICRGD